jgi:hypothetical protein
VLGDRVLRRIFGAKRDEIIAGLRKLPNEELRNLYSSPNIKSRRMKWAGNVAGMGKRGMHIGFSGKSRRKETSRKPRHTCENNIKVDGVVWTGLIWLRTGTSGRLL